MQPAGPIETIQLFPAVRRELLALLRGLTAEEWARSATPKWTVKDVALHLLGGEIGILSRRRDAFPPPGANIESWADLVALINQLNADWLRATQRLSPRVLCDLLEFTAPQAEEYFASLVPDALGVPVDWAGPGPAPVWLDVAREYTERWHHQQQIRDAVGKPGLKERRYFAPVLDAFVRALPWTYRDVAAPGGTTVQLTISGEAGGTWCLRRESGAWKLYSGAAEKPSAALTLDPEDAWRLFTKGRTTEQVRPRVRFEGDARLAEQALEMISIIG
jgi:uncharacterized protein (TIGR03083 family)